MGEKPGQWDNAHSAKLRFQCYSSTQLNLIFLAAMDKFDDRKLDLTHDNIKGHFGKCTFSAKIISSTNRVGLCFHWSLWYHLVYLFLLSVSLHSKHSQALILNCLKLFSLMREMPDNSLDDIQSISEVNSNCTEGSILTFLFQHIFCYLGFRSHELFFYMISFLLLEYLNVRY